MEQKTASHNTSSLIYQLLFLFLAIQTNGSLTLPEWFTLPMSEEQNTVMLLEGSQGCNRCQCPACTQFHRRVDVCILLKPLLCHWHSWVPVHRPLPVSKQRILDQTSQRVSTFIRIANQCKLSENLCVDSVIGLSMGGIDVLLEMGKVAPRLFCGGDVKSRSS